VYVALVHLAAVHNSYGILPDWYNVMGLTLIYSVRHVLGESFTHPMEVVWKKTYSRMMRVIIPVAVSGKTLAQLQSTVDIKQSEYKVCTPHRLRVTVLRPTSLTCSNGILCLCYRM
jgi:hypothetical protein